MKAPTRKQLAARRKFALMAKRRAKEARLRKKAATRKKATRKLRGWPRIHAASRARARRNKNPGLLKKVARAGKKLFSSGGVRKNPIKYGDYSVTFNRATKQYDIKLNGKTIMSAATQAGAKMTAYNLWKQEKERGRAFVAHHHNFKANSGRGKKRNGGEYAVTAYYKHGQYEMPKEKGSYGSLSEAKAKADALLAAGGTSASGARLHRVTVSIGYGGRELYSKTRNPFAKVKGTKFSAKAAKRVVRGAKRAAKKRTAAKRKIHSAYLREGWADMGGGPGYKKKVSGLHKGSNPKHRKVASAAGRRLRDVQVSTSARKVIRKRRRNTDNADRLYEFRGRPQSGTLSVTVPANTPDDIYQLGILTCLETEKETLEFAESEKVFLAADADDNLYIVNAPRVNPGNDDLGEIESISYVVKKDHLGGGITEWVHEFGEEGGERPSLIVDHDGLLQIVGGDYTITSAGIEN